MTKDEGLASREAARRLAEQGPNELARGESRAAWRFLAGPRCVWPRA